MDAGGRARQTSLASMGGDPGYHQLATTYQTGGQFEFSPGWFIGGSLGYEQSWLTGDSAKVSGQAGLAGLMIKHQTGPWLLSADLDGGFGSYQSTRPISVGSQTGTAIGSPDVFHIGGHVRAAYQMPLAGAMYVEPSLTLGVLDTNMAAYGETGSTSFNLNVHGSNNVTASVEPDGRIRRDAQPSTPPIRSACSPMSEWRRIRTTTGAARRTWNWLRPEPVTSPWTLEAAERGRQIEGRRRSLCR